MDDPDVAAQVEVTVKYAGYIDRQHDEVARHLAQETQPIPADLDYALVRGLSTEARQKLAAGKPETIGQASRISGITPAAVALLLVHLKRRGSARAAPRKGFGMTRFALRRAGMLAALATVAGGTARAPARRPRHPPRRWRRSSASAWCRSSAIACSGATSAAPRGTTATRA